MKGPRLPRWMYPGMHIKRWLFLLFVGIAILGLGAAIFIRDLYRTTAGAEIPIVYWLTGAWLEPQIRAALVAALGLALTGVGMWGLMRSVVSPFVGRNDSVLEVLYTKRYLARGPRIVAIGGGTGLSTLLRGLKGYSANITAVVAVADDGGSSGQLRQQLGIVPPGDIRNCIAALADAEPLMTQLMQYRFPAGSGLDHHAFGNLFIAAMTAVTGDFEEAVRESNRVLAVRGQVLPATSVPLNLSAQLVSGRTLYGQVGIATAEEPIERVFIEPADVRANGEALERILEADMIVLGPGLAVQQRAAEPADLRRPRRARRRPRHEGLRLQRRHPARRDAVDDRIGPPGSALRACRRRPRRLRHPQPQHRCAPPRGLARRAGRGGRAAARGAAGGHRRGGRHRPGQRPPPRSRQARGRAHAAAPGGPDLAAADASPRPPGGLCLLTVAVLLAGEVKGELARIQPARACDRRAELIGLVYGSSRDALRTLDHATARTAVHLASSLGLPVASPRAVVSDRVRVGSRHHLVVELNREALGPWSWEAAPACDRRAFLRGVLLGSGSISFGAGGPHVEFVLATRDPAEELQAALASLDVRALRTERRGRHVVYLKGQEEIVALLRLVGANRGVLELETHRVGRDVRARLNRLLNAEEANLGRTVRAADRQLSAIDRLEADGRLVGVAPALRETAAMRRRMPDADLDTLGAALGVSRSAVNHRLRRLVELAGSEED